MRNNFAEMQKILILRPIIRYFKTLFGVNEVLHCVKIFCLNAVQFNVFQSSSCRKENIILSIIYILTLILIFLF